MRQYIREIGTHSAIYTVSNVLTKAIGIILIPIYTRFLTVEDYGIISIVAPVINAFLIIYTFGMRATYGRFFFDHKDRSVEQKRTLGMITTFILLLGLVGNILLTFFGKPLFERLFPGVDFYPYIILGLWTSFFLLTFDMKLNLFRLRQQSIAYGAFSLLKFLLIVALTIYMVVALKMGALGKILSEFIICGVFFLASFFLLLKDLIISFNVTKFKELLKYALPILPHNLAGVVLGLTAKYYLNINQGVDAAGIFNIAFLMGTIMNLLITSINLTWNPFFMRTASSKQPEEAKRIFAQLTTYYTVVVVFLGLLIAMFSEEAIILLTTEPYYGAINIAPILVFAYVIQGGYYMVVTKIFYVKKATRYLAYITVTSALINIFFNALLVPKFGLSGSAWAFIITTSFMFIVTFFTSQKFYHIKYEYRRLLLLLMISMICVAGYYLFSLADVSYFVNILLKAGILFLYLALLFLFRLFRKSEIENLMDILKKIRRRYTQKGGKDYVYRN